MEEFLELKGELVPLDKLTELQKKYYDYTCQEGDCIRTCMVPSPQPVSYTHLYKNDLNEMADAYRKENQEYKVERPEDDLFTGA